LLLRIFLLALLGTAFFVAFVAWEVYRYSEVDEARPADAAIVLGAAVFRDRPSPVLRERINHAIWLYENGYVERIIFTGGVGWNDARSEAEVARDYALAQGVPSDATLVEITSVNTAENLYNARRVAAEHDLHTFLLVSTPFHMKRAMALADDLEMEAYTSPTRTTRWISDRTKRRAYWREVAGYLAYLVVKAG
jgi:uncharacterized SAM-binding protein YcdF (DUF218 family)